jgi:hypothetical protein
MSHMPYQSQVISTVESGLPKGGRGTPGHSEFLLSPVWIIPGVALVSTRRWRHIDVMLLPPSVHCTDGGSTKEPQTGWSIGLRGKRQISLSPGLNTDALYWREIGCKTGNILYINCRRLAPFQKKGLVPSITNARMHTNRERPLKKKQTVEPSTSFSFTVSVTSSCNSSSHWKDFHKISF